MEMQPNWTWKELDPETLRHMFVKRTHDNVFADLAVTLDRDLIDAPVKDKVWAAYELMTHSMYYGKGQ